MSRRKSMWRKGGSFMSERKAIYQTNRKEKKYYTVRIDGEGVNYCPQCGNRLVIDDAFANTHKIHCLFCDASMSLHQKIHWKTNKRKFGGDIK